ncbi:hypothetical protein DL95DRAFT_407611 [Leptodontidium sp. 2 PMI_412]|nr:hypothetical protein DL95DRAFT_407611 [Leptodontidium sp. 2 PMI_412]
MAPIISGIIASMTTTIVYDPSNLTSTTTNATLTTNSNNCSPFGTIPPEYYISIIFAIAGIIFVTGLLNDNLNARTALAHEFRDGTAEERLARVEEFCQHWLGKRKGDLKLEGKEARIDMLDLDEGGEEEGLLAGSTCDGWDWYWRERADGAIDKIVW